MPAAFQLHANFSNLIQFEPPVSLNGQYAEPSRQISSVAQESPQRLADKSLPPDQSQHSRCGLALMSSFPPCVQPPQYRTDGSATLLASADACQWVKCAWKDISVVKRFRIYQKPISYSHVLMPVSKSIVQAPPSATSSLAAAVNTPARLPAARKVVQPLAPPSYADL